MSNHYQLERTSIVDHAGTHLNEVLLTTSMQVLQRHIAQTIEKPGGFAEDVLAFAWEAAIVDADDDALRYWFGPALRVLREREVLWSRALIPDMRLVRGRLTLEVAVDQELLRKEFGRRRKKTRKPEVFRARLTSADGACEETFNSLAALGSPSNVLNPLREEAGEVVVEFDLTAMLDTIALLEPPLLERGLRCVPFFEESAFKELWADEGAYTKLISGEGGWDGIVPMNRWFHIQKLEELCDDAGVSLDFEAFG